MDARWHAQSVEQVLTELRTTVSGLTTAEVEERRRTFGPNVIAAVRPPSDLVLFTSQFQSPLVVILVIAAGLSFLFDALADAWIILGVVVFNGIIGFLQERRAGQAMENLRSLTPQIVRVLRNGEERELPATALVVGDVVMLETGAIVPADGRLVEAVNLKINEAVFTGESVPAEKTIAPLDEKTAISDRRNLAWRGTTVSGGRGRLVLTEVGTRTRFGGIVQAVAKIPHTETPFQKSIADFARRLAFVILMLSLVVFALTLVRQFPLPQSILLAISLVVSLIPEGLPVIITLTFAWGMWQMAKRRALIRKLVAVETLGSVTVIASDKTGTLTFGEMVVEEIVLDHRRLIVSGEGYRRVGDFFERHQRIAPTEDPVVRTLLEVGMLNNDSHLSHDERGQERWIGDPTEISLVVLGEKAGIKRDELDTAFPRVGEFPFDFKLRYMVTFHRTPSRKFLIAVKGAPRQLLALCTKKRTPNGVGPLTDRDRADIRQAFEEMATRSLRGLGVAYAETDSDWRAVRHDNLGQHLTYLGLIGIRDQVRPEARATIMATRRAGIRVVMVTGDYRVTAVTVAKEIGILGQHDNERERVLDGADLESLNDETLRQRLRQAVVFSRVSPEQKLRIARLFKANGEIVAMTGDGINDVPALMEANIGVAIGMSSTDAAKEAAEMVVTDGNLSSIVAAVEEGRVMFRNIQRVLIFLLASNFGSLLLILLTMFLGMPLPLLPIHIIWLNAITDPLPGIALAREPKSPYIMLEPPHPPDRPVLSSGHWWRIALDGTAITVSTLFVFVYALMQHRPSVEVYALTLTTIALSEWFVALTSRSAQRSVFSRILGNRLLLLALAVVIGLQAVILYTPALSKAFHLAPLKSPDWALAVVAALFVVAVEEVRKWFARQRHRPLPS